MDNFWEYSPKPQVVIDSIEMRKLKIINSYQKILIFAGAGMSQESNLPIFTDNKTLIDHSPNNQKNLIDLFNSHEPHIGYTKLLNYCTLKNKDYYIFTSNIDGYFTRTNFDKSKIIEIHGNIFNSQCPHNCTNDNCILPFIENAKCKHCGELLVPNVFSGGFSHWIYKHQDIENKMNQDIKSQPSDWLIIEIGAGINVPVIRDYSEILVEDYGMGLIRINPEHYQIPKELLSKKTIRIRYKATTGINILYDS